MQAGDTCQVAAAFKERVVRERACQSDGSGLHGQQPKALQQARTPRDGSRQCPLVGVKNLAAPALTHPLSSCSPTLLTAETARAHDHGEIGSSEPAALQVGASGNTAPVHDWCP